MAQLDEYRRKRNFKRTPEPGGASARRRGKGGNGGNTFVIHKHAARQLHFDLRLENNGVLESWAVPKGPSMETGVKRLAVRVEDHPIEYGNFEGTIPKKEYGGGTIMIWDRGAWTETRRSDGRIDFVLAGHKLSGSWTLTRTGKNDRKGCDNWLLIKRSDPHTAESLPQSEVEMDRSVVSGRTMAQIAEGQDPAEAHESGHERAATDARSVPGARRARAPLRVKPQLATLVDAVPTGPEWLHEIKFDGYRIVASLEKGSVRLWSRNGKDWTRRFSSIAASLEKIPAASAVLDGEVVAMEKNGVSSFRKLQQSLSEDRTGELVYQAFDLIHLDGASLRDTPLLERKRALSGLLERADFEGSGSVRFTEHLEGDGADLYAHACRLGLEGIISKHVNARYRATRNRQWRKVKCVRQDELLVGGYTDPQGTRIGFGALLLGARDDQGKVVYAGKVGTGFSNRQLKSVLARLQKLKTAQCPFDSCPEQGGIHWVRPELVAEVEFTEWTRDGRLRHPTFRGLRDDKNPEDIRMPELSDSNMDSNIGVPARKSKRSRENQVAGVTLSNPDRVLYPDQGITKLELARYYEEIASWILPQVRSRPLSLLRCPQGRVKECFFQKHPGVAISKHIARIDIREKSGTTSYLYIEKLSDLVALVQAGTLELHVWGCTVTDLERPDTLVFDLDPGPDVPWPDVVEASRSLHHRLHDLGLDGFVRLTGGKGLHVVVPLKPKSGWDEVKGFARAVASAHANDDPKKFTTNMSKAKRRGRIFIDYLRNGRGATAIASYSTRARKGAPVAVPIRRDELSPALTSNRYNIDSVRRRLAALRSDPWEGFEEARRPLTRKLLATVGVRGD
jgi:bifunctional non-homologous end joining protein LigD